MNKDNTTMFRIPIDKEDEIRDALSLVCDALREKGYNPIGQIVGYIMSGDPSFITSHKDARKLMTKFDRDVILEVVFEDYLGK